MVSIFGSKKRVLSTLALVPGFFMPLAASAAPDAAKVQAAWGEMAATLTTVASSNVASQISQLHNTLKNYKWRTVYEFGQVSKSPLPGTRLKLLPMPTMSQMDAETYLLQKMPDLPGMNCPVSHMGGPAGRPMTVTIPGKSSPIAISDAQIKALFMQASPTQGAQAYEVYYALKSNTCAAIYNTAQLTFRFEKFKSYPSKWEECKKDGVSITEWHVKQGFDFPGNHHRTAQVGGGILFQCGAVYSGNAQDALKYDSWFKWSDKDTVPLNFIQQIKDAGESPNSCPKVCIPIVGGGGASASVCLGLDPGISAAGDTLPMRLGAKFRAYDRDKSLCTPVIHVPAPFGIAESLGEMADGAKQQAMEKMQAQLVSILPVNKDSKEKIQKLMAAVSQ